MSVDRGSRKRRAVHSRAGLPLVLVLLAALAIAPKAWAETTPTPLPPAIEEAVRSLAGRVATLEALTPEITVALLPPVSAGTMGELSGPIAAAFEGYWGKRPGVHIIPIEKSNERLQSLFTTRQRIATDVDRRIEFLGESNADALVTLAVNSTDKGLAIAANIWSKQKPASVIQLTTWVAGETNILRGEAAVTSQFDSVAPVLTELTTQGAPEDSSQLETPPMQEGDRAVLIARLPAGTSLTLDGTSLGAERLRFGTVVPAGQHHVSITGRGESMAEDVFFATPGSRTQLSIDTRGSFGPGLGSACLSAILPGLGVAARASANDSGTAWTKFGALVFYSCALGVGLSETSSDTWLRKESVESRRQITRSLVTAGGAGYLMNLIGSWSFGARASSAGTVTRVTHRQVR